MERPISHFMDEETEVHRGYTLNPLFSVTQAGPQEAGGPVALYPGNCYAPLAPLAGPCPGFSFSVSVPHI